MQLQKPKKNNRLQVYSQGHSSGGSYTISWPKRKKTQDDCFRLETAKICGSEGLGDLEDIYGFYRSEK